MILTTARLRLRPLAPEDLDDVVALHADPRVMAFITGVAEGRESVTRDSFPELLRRPAWAVLEDGVFLGWASLRLEGAEAEIGYRLARAAWGQGRASEAARALVAFGMTDLGLARIWGQTMAVNTASRRVMEKAGLSFVRTFHLDWADPLPGAELGEVEYALDRDSWPV